MNGLPIPPRALLVAAIAIALAACHAQPTRPEHPVAQAPAPKANFHRPSKSISGDSDGGPREAPDISMIAEPVPHDEPLAAFGNRSPYTVLGRTYTVLPTSRGYVERGTASWYGEKFDGRLTSSHDLYDMYAFTAAHKTLPLPTYARVTNLDNGKSVIVKVNDRGPFHEDRILDLSYVAALKLGIVANGTGRVEVRALSEADEGAPPGSLLAAQTPPVRRHEDPYAYVAVPPETRWNDDRTTSRNAIARAAPERSTAATVTPLPGSSSGSVYSGGAGSQPTRPPASAPRAADPPPARSLASAPPASTPSDTALASRSAAPPIAAARPSSSAAASGAPCFVQAGAFSDRGNAERLAQRLRAGRYGEVSLDRGVNGLSLITRVKIGPFNDDQVGERVVAKLAEAGIKAIVVHD
jgi:rare lipoprotein A